jgi:hypothetical protein
MVVSDGMSKWSAIKDVPEFFDQMLANTLKECSQIIPSANEISNELSSIIIMIKKVFIYNVIHQSSILR